MNSKINLKVIFIVFLIIGINGCQGKKVDNSQINQNLETSKITVFNFDNEKELADYNKLNLDENYPNLLNAKISKTDYNEVMKSWTDLHQRIGTYLSENEFDWEVEENSITIVQKIYFNADGKIENYFFNVLNENVTEDKKEEFADLILNFAINNKIGFGSERKFAQCGKTKYLNK